MREGESEGGREGGRDEVSVSVLSGIPVHGAMHMLPTVLGNETGELHACIYCSSFGHL